MPLLAIVAGVIITVAILYLAFRSLTRKRLIDDTPTSMTRGVFIGLVELKGTAESDTPLSAYLSGTKCVYYEWHVDEHWSRVVTETYTDSKGHTHTRTRTESGWTTVARGGESPSFYLQDDTGIIRIVPDGAEITAKITYDRTCHLGDPLYYEKGPSGAIPNSDHRRRFCETSLPLHVRLYVIGQARERQDIVAAEIARDKDSPMFLISTKTEKQISSAYNLQFWLWSILGLVIAIGAAVGWNLLQPTTGVKWQTLIIAAAVFVTALGIGWLWTVFNSLIRLRQMTQQGWSQVDVQLKRRYDLIPNLVNIIEGYRQHEKETQQIVTELRSQLEATPPGQAGPDHKGILPILRAIMERYPELKSSDLFLGLQKSLAETEQRIALARDYYNSIATFYNTRLQVIPDNFVAALARFHHCGLLEARDFERATIEVKLAE